MHAACSMPRTRVSLSGGPLADAQVEIELGREFQSVALRRTPPPPPLDWDWSEVQGMLYCAEAIRTHTHAHTCMHAYGEAVHGTGALCCVATIAGRAAERIDRGCDVGQGGTPEG